MREMNTILEQFKNGDYKGALKALEALEAEGFENPRICIYALAAKGLSETPVKGEGLTRAWNGIKELLKDGREYSLLEETRQVMMLYANAVYCNCNDRQKMEYTVLQKDVSFENKERLLHDFQRILLEADTEYKAILQVVYEYAAMAAAKGNTSEASTEFLEGALKSMLMAAELQAEIGLEEIFDPMELARCACQLRLSDNMTEAWETRRELLSITLRGEKALGEWEIFAPYAAPGKKAELEREVKKLRRREKLRSWMRFGKREE